MSAINAIILRPSGDIPQIGLGTWQSKIGGEVKKAVAAALDAGYRHFDCALAYENETEIGEALADAFTLKKVNREELFITSKVWNTYHRSDLVEKCVQLSLDRLGLDYLDLCLIHWPMGFLEDKEMFPKDEEGQFIFSETDYLDTYKAMEDLVDAGKLRAIGLSNFNSQQIQRVLDNCRIAPANLQIESHPYFPNQELIDFAFSKSITVTAYSPLGNQVSLFSKADNPNLLEDPILNQIASKVGRSVAQIVLRWHLQRGVIIIPKSVRFERLKENIDILDFHLSPEDMAQVNSLRKTNGRILSLSSMSHHKYYPFSEPF